MAALFVFHMAPKSPRKTPNTPEPGSLVKPPHGKGLLRYGSEPGNTPGTGRPKNAIREDLARIVDEAGVAFVGRVVRGEEEGATIQNRLDAFEKAAKFSIGVIKGVPDEVLRDKLSQTIRIITETLPPEQAELLLSRIQPVWK